MKKNKDPSFIASAAGVLALLVWVGTSVVVWRSPVEGAPQNPKRMLLRERPGAGEPVTITKLTVNSNEVKFKNGFEAGDDWFKSIAVTVENRSQKPVTYVEIRLMFPRQDGSTAPMVVLDMRYGGSEDLASAQGRPAILPGESTEIEFGENSQAVFVDAVRKAGYVSVDLIKLGIRTVMWNDGTKWYGGRIWSNKFGKWSPG